MPDDDKNNAPTKDAPSVLSGRLEVIVPEESFIAGSPCLLRLVIRNTFKAPVRIVAIQGPRASDIDQATEASEKKFSGPVLRALAGGAIRVMGIRLATNEPEETRLIIHAKEKAQVQFGRPIVGFEKVEIIADDNSTIDMRPVAQPATLHDGAVLEPQCETVAYISLATSGWLFFRPQRKTLSSQITYELEGTVRTQVVSATFEVHPPLASMMLGSLIGGALGAVAKLLNGTSSIIKNLPISSSPSLHHWS